MNGIEGVGDGTGTRGRSGSIRRTKGRSRSAALTAAALCLLAAGVALAAGSKGGDALKRLNYPEGLTIDRNVPYERAKAFVSPAALTFGSVKATIVHGSVQVSGLLTNPTDKNVPVIVFPVGPTGFGPGGFHANIVHSDLVGWYAPEDPARPPSPPRQPPAPPPPEGYVVPARSEILFSIVLDVSQMKYRGSPEVDVDWTFHFWNKPHLTGRIKAHLPPR